MWQCSEMMSNGILEVRNIILSRRILCSGAFRAKRERAGKAKCANLYVLSYGKMKITPTNLKKRNPDILILYAFSG
tara:strand:- start:776 stop:1003 length:228 start_codon:yes stop_codon:yes gene_type:complete